jgi:hypothetical protein
MSVSSDFDDMVKICEFYSGDGLPIVVDYDNRAVFLGDCVIEPLVKNGHITDYFVTDPDFNPHLVTDLDSYLHRVVVDREEF